MNVPKSTASAMVRLEAFSRVNPPPVISKTTVATLRFSRIRSPGAFTRRVPAVMEPPTLRSPMLSRITVPLGPTSMSAAITRLPSDRNDTLCPSVVPREITLRSPVTYRSTSPATGVGDMST